MSIVNLNAANIFNAIDGGSLLSIINSTLHPSYVIRKHGDAAIALEFSGMASVQPVGRAQITTAPVEGGKYQAINKVKEPSRVRCSVIINGLTGLTGNIPNIFDLTFTSQSETLKTIHTMLSQAQVYDIETPKETLESYDLVGHFYEVTHRNGVSLLIVYLEFQEVMQQMEVSLSGAQSNKKPTDDQKSQGDTGTGAGGKTNGAAKPSTLDELSKSWGSLKSALSSAVGNVEKTISTGFQSALDTVKEPVLDVVSSATKKAADVAKYIAEATKP
ncbi:hypothetical protein ACW6AV_001648 [Edwardsiella piscicida]|uniref:hypothetical protein n=1 Tax=Edwardsiella piscicida TaxID=1263550 RepID=UPI00101AC4F3|nr:hypothetical protein [Edwardsiella piscicida]ELM3737077.1 hypothetical protein [Edwardsiella piscicida]QBB13919.1 hypothetical protein EVK84_15935 [Edwardsiella piscicida]WGS75542.1 hypothetical protein PED68_09185 [Edwardsiella piscicida]WGS78931.1 hypothetical protein PED70_09190 [Edwardsiella piscicida]